MSDPIDSKDGSEEVAMQDGSLETFHRRSKIKTARSFEKNGAGDLTAEIKFSLRTGSILTRAIVVPAKALKAWPELEANLRYMVHGLVQKVGDCLVKVGDLSELDGVVEAQLATFDRGEFNDRPAVDPFAGLTDLVEAVRRAKQKDTSEETRLIILNYLKAMPELEFKTVKANPTVKAHLADINAEKARAKLGQTGATGLEGLEI